MAVKRRYEVGLERLMSTEASVQGMKETLTALQPQLEESTRQTEAAMLVITKESADADVVKQVRACLEHPTPRLPARHLPLLPRVTVLTRCAVAGGLMGALVRVRVRVLTGSALQVATLLRNSSDARSPACEQLQFCRCCGIHRTLARPRVSTALPCMRQEAAAEGSAQRPSLLFIWGEGGKGSCIDIAEAGSMPPAQFSAKKTCWTQPDSRNTGLDFKVTHAAYRS